MLSMIAEEIDILGELALDYLESAAKLDELANDWLRLAARVKAACH